MAVVAQLGRDVSVAREHRRHRSRQLLVRVDLQHVALRSQRPSLFQIGRARLHGQEYQLRSHSQAANPGCRLKTGHQRHADIGDDQVRLELLRRLDQRCPILDRGYNVVVAFQEALDLLKHGSVIVSQEDALADCHSRPFCNHTTEPAGIARLGISLVFHSGIRPCWTATLANSPTVRTPSLAISRARWNSTVFTDTCRMSAISLFPFPSTISCRISRWRSVSSSASLLTSPDRFHNFVRTFCPNAGVM